MKYKKYLQDDRPESASEKLSVQGEYREQYPAYNPDEVHGDVGTPRLAGKFDYFSELHLQEFHAKDLLEGQEAERRFFYRELVAILTTVVFIVILLIANSLHFR